MKRLIVIPTEKEIESFLQACTELGFDIEAARIGRLSVRHIPELDVTVAQGGLGKAQFALQTQHLLDAYPNWSLVICAGAAGALVDTLAPGDIVVATETVEHDIQNKFGKSLVPRFHGAESVLANLSFWRSELPTVNIHVGPVASGDEDVVDLARRQVIHQLTGALAVAWEGAGGARACHFSGVPFIEIRGITDSANTQAAVDFRLNLTNTMRHIAMLMSAWIRNGDP